MSAKWFLPDGQQISWFNAEPGRLAYQHQSGETHYLNEATIAMLEQLRERSATAAELMGDLPNQADDSHRADAIARFLRVLQRLEELGLAARALAPDERA